MIPAPPREFAKRLKLPLAQLLDALEQHGFRDEDGTLLSNSREWHQLRQQIAGLKAYAIEADKIVKQVEAAHVHNG